MATRPAETGDLRLAAVVVNAVDRDRAVAFWSAALGYRSEGMTGPDGQFAKLVDPEGTGPSVLVQRTEEIPKDPAPVHIDLYTGKQEQHIERLVKLGATRVEDWRYPADPDFVVLRDTEGNEFCVVDG